MRQREMPALLHAHRDAYKTRVLCALVCRARSGEEERSANSGMLTKLVLHGGIRAKPESSRQLHRHVVVVVGSGRIVVGRLVKTLFIIPRRVRINRVRDAAHQRQLLSNYTVN